MKLRLFPIMISLAVSSVLLFGGWYVYDSVAMQNPMSELVSGTPGVIESKVDVSGDRVTVDVRLRPDASLREVHRHIAENGASMIGTRQLDVRVNGDSTSDLDAWWSRTLFDMAQAMETKQYGQIPDILQRMAAAHPGITAESEMDGSNVYVRITDGTHSKFVTLPRTPARMGVWPNE